MSELTGRLCDYCGAPLRSTVDGACPFCHVPIVALTAMRTLTAATPGMAPGDADLVLLDPGPDKITAIKNVRRLTDLGLKEAKDLVDATDGEAGSVICRGMPVELAMQWLDLFRRDGARAEVRFSSSPPPPPPPPPTDPPPVAPPVTETGPPVDTSGAAETRLDVGTRYDLLLVDSGPQKIAVIKTVRGLTSLGLREAKDLVDGASRRQPQVLASAVDAAFVEQWAHVFNDCGASVEARPTGQ